MQIVTLLLSVIVIVDIAARRLKIAPSILLVIAGVILALFPQLPRVELAPELVLFGILPPLVYSAGVQMSWRDFRFNLRPIVLFAVGCVIFSACAIAAAGHWLLGLPTAVALVLGAVVAPTDVVAPLAIARRLGVPRHLRVILEGEGLVNDATALILYRFAVAAVDTGLFSLPEAAGTFVGILVGEIAYGVGIGWLSLRIRRWAANPRVEITLSLMTPYAAFWLPALLGGSGVLATVAAGLYVSWNGPLLISAATRLQGIFFWDLLIYLLEGSIFLVMGLQAGTINSQVNAFALSDLGIDIAVVLGVAIGARLIWAFASAYLPRLMIPSLARRDPVPPWQWVFFLGFVGVRGVVSLAAALGIPFLTESGAPFPDRDLLTAVTFGIIVVTLVGQGLILPFVTRMLGLTKASALERERDRHAEHRARVEALAAAHEHLDRMAKKKQVADEILTSLRARHAYRERGLLMRAAGSDEIRSKLIEAERKFIFEMLREGRITDEARRRMERELDLEELSVAYHREDGVEPPL
jgi:CPA1 family monovalent cation:H+ antiporter